MSEIECQQYKFTIDVLSIKTMPMARLADYMKAYADLLGDEKHVHFSNLINGSIVLVSNVEEQASHKVAQRTADLRDGRGTKDAIKAFECITAMLANDNTTARLNSPSGAEVLSFPKQTKPIHIKYGPFWERGSFDGIIIRLGGRDDTIPVLLQDGEVTIKCQTSREISKRLAAHYLSSPIRVHGNGKWIRNENGCWELLEFRIEEFEVLDDSSLTQIVSQLRTIEGGIWHESSDAISDILSLRRDEKDKH
jgi:hypothetical protein